MLLGGAARCVRGINFILGTDPHPALSILHSGEPLGNQGGFAIACRGVDEDQTLARLQPFAQAREHAGSCYHVGT